MEKTISTKQKTLAEKIARQILDIITEKNKIISVNSKNRDEFYELSGDQTSYEFSTEIEHFPVILYLDFYYDDERGVYRKWRYLLAGYEGTLDREVYNLDELIQDILDILILNEGGTFMDLSTERILYDEISSHFGPHWGDVREALASPTWQMELVENPKFERSENDRLLTFSELSKEELIFSLNGLKMYDQILIEDENGFFYRIQFRNAWGSDPIYRLLEFRDPDNNVITDDKVLFHHSKGIQDAAESIIDIIQDWHDEYEGIIEDVETYRKKTADIYAKINDKVASSSNKLNSLINDRNSFIIDKLAAIKDELYELISFAVDTCGGKILFRDLTFGSIHSSDILSLSKKSTFRPEMIYERAGEYFLRYPADFGKDDTNLTDIPVMELFKFCSYFSLETLLFNMDINYDLIDSYLSIELKKEITRFLDQNPSLLDNDSCLYDDYRGYLCSGLVKRTDYNDYERIFDVESFCVTWISRNQEGTYDIEISASYDMVVEGETNDLCQLYPMLRELVR